VSRAGDRQLRVLAKCDAAIAAQKRLAIVANCSRAHPHEKMSTDCELRTVIARLVNEQAHMLAALRRFVSIRAPNVKWTKAETERSLAALEVDARSILARVLR